VYGRKPDGANETMSINAAMVEAVDFEDLQEIMSEPAPEA